MTPLAWEAPVVPDERRLEQLAGREKAVRTRGSNHLIQRMDAGLPVDRAWRILIAVELPEDAPAPGRPRTRTAAPLVTSRSSAIEWLATPVAVTVGIDPAGIALQRGTKPPGRPGLVVGRDPRMVPTWPEWITDALAASQQPAETA